MNKVILIGRLTKDPVIGYQPGKDGALCIARYTLAVDRMKKGEADFISCVAFGKTGEFVEKYLQKGSKIAIEGRIQTGSYEKDGVKHYTTDVIVDKHEFCESKTTEISGNNIPGVNMPVSFEDLPSIEDDAELPFV